MLYTTPGLPDVTVVEGWDVGGAGVGGAGVGGAAVGGAAVGGAGAGGLGGSAKEKCRGGYNICFIIETRHKGGMTTHDFLL